MISFLRGILAGKTEWSPRGTALLVEVGGVGYDVQTSARSLAQAPAVGEPVTVYTTLVVREDAMTLVGFLSHEERDLFTILQGASGVGTKVALALLSELPVSGIVQAVVSDDYRPLTAARGVGPKLAQKITLDLKEKMAVWREMAVAVRGPAVSAPALSGEAVLEAETVLLSLGYSREEIARSLDAVGNSLKASGSSGPEPPSSELILRESLRWLAQSS